MKNRCTHLGKQVHVFGETGAPIWGNRCTCSGESIMVESTKVICAKTRIYNFYATSLSRTDVRIINSQLSIVNYQFSIINCQFSIINCQLSIINCQLNLWRWRESNPRPHKETIRFLHAYSRLDFRVTARPGPPTGTLSPEVSLT